MDRPAPSFASVVPAPRVAARETRTVDGTAVVLSVRDGAPLIVLVRMASRGAGLWDAIWDGLAGHFSVLQFDLRMPSSEALEDPRAVFSGLAARCAEIAAALGHERFHLFGWSGGTHVALRCAADFPGRVASSVLLGPFWQLDDMRSSDKGFEFARAMIESGDLSLYAYYWYMGGLSPGFVESRYDQVAQWAEARIRADSFLQRDTAAILKWMRVLRGTWTGADELRAIAAPTLILAHELDPWHAGPSARMARELHRHMPQAAFAVLDGLGSMAPIENPQRVVAEVLRFLLALPKQNANAAPA